MSGGRRAGERGHQLANDLDVGSRVARAHAQRIRRRGLIADGERRVAEA